MRLPKALRSPRIGERLVEGRLRAAERAGADVDASAVEARHGDLEAHALVREPVGDGHARILEDHGGGGLRIPAHLLLLRAEGHAGHVLLDHEGRDAGGALRAGAHHGHVDVGGAGARDELLDAVDDVMIAVTHRLGLERRRVRACARLCETVAADQLHGG